MEVEYSTTAVQHLENATWIKLPGLLTEKLIHFSIMVHVTMDFKEFHWKYLGHPSYNLNLMLINIYCLVLLKKLFKRRRVLNDYEVKAWMCQWVQTRPGTFFMGNKQVVYQRKNVSVSLVITAAAGGVTFISCLDRRLCRNNDYKCNIFMDVTNTPYTAENSELL